MLAECGLARVITDARRCSTWNRGVILFGEGARTAVCWARDGGDFASVRLTWPAC